NRQVNPTDSRVFWSSLYVTPVVWGLFGVLALLKLSFEWVIVSCVAISLSMANVVGYMKCEKDASQKFANFVPGQNIVQGAVGSFISSRVG
ncbi:Golgi apparatus membrane protein TVP23 A, partial [Nowakowskiella sp. JEL0078]